MNITPQDFLGPFALTLGLLVVVGALWRDHLRADADDRAMRDRAITLAERLVADAEGRQRATDRDSRRATDRER